MGKRTSTSSAVAPAKGKAHSRQSVAKAARIEEDPFEKKCAPLLRFLATTKAGGGLSGTVRSMLQGMLPYAFQTAKADRHRFQVRLIDDLESLLNEEKTMHLSKVKTNQEEVLENKAEQEKVSAELLEAGKRVQLTLATKDDRKKEQDATDAALKASEQSKAVVLKQKDEMAAKLQVHVDEKAEYEQAVSDLSLLVDWQTTGQNWHYRNKGVDKLVKLLDRAGAGETLCATISNTLKTRKDARGAFSGRVVECAETTLKDKVAAVGALIESNASETVEMDKAVADAEDDVVAHQRRHNESIDKSVAADNAWVESQQHEFDKKNLLEELQDASTALAEAGKKACVSRDSFLELLTLFEKLRDGEVAQAEASHVVEVPVNPADVAMQA